MSKFAIELDDSKYPTSYGKVHASGCRDCSDPEPLGDTFEEVVANWPWPEAAEDVTLALFTAMKYLCPDCQLIGPIKPWPCNVAYHRDLVAIPRFTQAKYLFETDRYSRGMV